MVRLRQIHLFSTNKVFCPLCIIWAHLYLYNMHKSSPEVWPTVMSASTPPPHWLMRVSSSACLLLLTNKTLNTSAALLTLNLLYSVHAKLMCISPSIQWLQHQILVIRRSAWKLVDQNQNWTILNWRSIIGVCGKWNEQLLTLLNHSKNVLGLNILVHLLLFSLAHGTSLQVLPVPAWVSCRASPVLPQSEDMHFQFWF